MKIPSYLAYPFAAAAAWGVFQAIANRQLFHPMKYPGGWWEQQTELGAEDVWFPASDGVRLHGWWSAVAGPMVTLFLHGNAGNVSHRGSHLGAIRAAGSSILIADYRGYGRSEGRPSEKGLYADAEGAYEYLRRRGYAPERIIVHGESLGTSVAVALAVRKPVAGVVLEAPFTSAGDIAHRVVPFLGPLLVRAFPTRRWVGRLSVPLLIIHGDADEVVPFSMGEELFAAAPGPKRFWRIPGGGHSDIVEAGGPAYVELLRDFYRRIDSRA